MKKQRVVLLRVDLDVERFGFLYHDNGEGDPEHHLIELEEKQCLIITIAEVLPNGEAILNLTIDEGKS